MCSFVKRGPSPLSQQTKFKISGKEPARVPERNTKPTIANPKSQILETNSKLKNLGWRIKSKLIVDNPNANIKNHFKNSSYESCMKYKPLKDYQT
jgi:hypothetical protein